MFAVSSERLLDIDLLKLANGFGQQYPTVEHLSNERFHSLSHIGAETDYSLSGNSCPVNSR